LRSSFQKINFSKVLELWKSFIDREKIGGSESAAPNKQRMPFVFFQFKRMVSFIFFHPVTLSQRVKQQVASNQMPEASFTLSKPAAFPESRERRFC